MMTQTEQQNLWKRLCSKDKQLSERAFEEIIHLNALELCTFIESQVCAPSYRKTVLWFVLRIWLVTLLTPLVMLVLFHNTPHKFQIMQFTLFVFCGSVCLFPHLLRRFSPTPIVRVESLMHYAYKTLNNTPLKPENLPVLLWLYQRSYTEMSVRFYKAPGKPEHGREMIGSDENRELYLFLVETLSHITPEIAQQILPSSRVRLICDLNTPYNQYSLSVSAIQALPALHAIKAIPYLEGILKHKSSLHWAQSPTRKARLTSVAEASLTILKKYQKEQERTGELLRPSRMPTDNLTLLRPAKDQAEPEQELLRPNR